MSNVIYKNGKAEITIPATESVAIYTKGVANVYRKVGYPNVPYTTTLLGEVNNEQTVFGAYSTGATIIIEAGAGDVFYEIGVAPVVKELYQTQYQPVPTALDATGAVTAAAMLGGIVTSAAAAVAGTVPTGTVLEAASEFAIGDSFDWSVIKVGANAFTVTAATDHTLVGDAVVATATSGMFRTRKSAAGVFVTYRIG
jgi:hypothetical protein